jgi:pimeloyl-ACP methyl ester carboxylesterase
MPGLTRTRIVALVLIGLAFLGLAYLGVGRGGEAVSVPKGALAGDLLLEPCTYETEAGSYAADCGTLVVPENRADPGSRAIAVDVTRIRALSPNPREPIFRLEGGPGLTNMDFARASRFAEDHDVVLVGYRGVDSSVRLDCPEVESALKHSTDFLANESLAAYSNGFRTCAARLTDEGVDLRGYSIVAQADDLEAARKALGYSRIDLLSESAGTRLAMIYAWRYPQHVNRSVMIGVNPPGNYLWNPQATDEQIDRYSKLCAADRHCSGQTDDLGALIDSQVKHIPDHWLFLPIKPGNVEIASFLGLFETTQELAAPIYASTTLSSWLSQADGDASGLWFQSLAADLFLPGSFVWGEYAAVGRVDAQAADRYFSAGHTDANLGYAGTKFTWGGGGLAHSWPATPDEDEYDQIPRSDAETLLIGGELDFTTPPQIAAKELLPYLPNGHQVVLPGYGHSTSFWEEQANAGTKLVTTFLDTGRMDKSGYRPRPFDFTPELRQPSLAKGMAGTMVGLAALTVLSLVWMPLRLRRRKRFGGKTSALLRSVYAVVLGLGGWFAGILLVITTMPGTPLDDPLLAVLSVGVPVGLGLYWAWLDRGLPASMKLEGFALGVVGALVGAWLGFRAGTDLLALITSIVGAIAGGNLGLVLLDVAGGRGAAERSEVYNEVPGGVGGLAGGASAGR